MSSRHIEYCINNLRRFTQSVYDAIEEEHPAVKQKVRGCLNRCDDCKHKPFALVNERKFLKVASTLVETDTPEELRAQLFLQIGAGH